MKTRAEQITHLLSWRPLPPGIPLVANTIGQIPTPVGVVVAVVDAEGVGRMFDADGVITHFSNYASSVRYLTSRQDQESQASALTDRIMMWMITNDFKGPVAAYASAAYQIWERWWVKNKGASDLPDAVTKD